MKNFLALSSILFSFSSFSTTISGTCTSYSGEKIELIAYNDLFNELEIIEDSKKINKDGSFSLEFKNNITRKISLKIRDFKASFYITPNTNYKIVLDQFDKKSAPPLSLDKQLTFSFKQQDKDSLNYKLIEVNQVVSKFQSEFYLDYIKSRIKPKISILESRLQIDSTKQDYLNNYKRYVLARQKLFARFKKKEIFEAYLKENYEPQNLAYTELFSDFYKQWFNQYISSRDMQILYRSIENSELDSLKNLLRENDFLQSEEVMEMVLIKELFRESLLAKKFDREKLILLLDSVKEITHFENIHRTCDFYLENLNKLKVRSLAPDFQLENQNNEFKSLQDFKDKYIYLTFWNSTCNSCIRSMSILNDLYPKYKDSIEFVSIGLDEDAIVDEFVRTNNYNWTFLKGNGKLDLRKDYNVSGLPLYYFIAKDGTIIQSPAESPGEGIELFFKYLFDSKRNTQEKIWDWNKPLKD